MSTAARSLAVSLVAGALFLVSGESRAQDGGGLFDLGMASVTLGPYARVELGASFPQPSDAFWDPRGEDDPRIFFDVDATDVPFGSVALGYDWQIGWRAELAYIQTGTSDVAAPCSGTADGSACNAHADITSASVRTRGLMANVYYVPAEARGSNSILQPFVVAGLGVVENEVGEWTRSKNPRNPTAGNRPVMTYLGKSSTEFAWSIGLGASLQVSRTGSWPILMEAAWRYYDFGTASGSSTPTSGQSEPRSPFQFDNKTQVISLGLRVPLRRY